MRLLGTVCVAIAALTFAGCIGPSEEQEACAVYRSFFEQLPAKERQALRGRSSPSMLSDLSVNIPAPTHFERGAGPVEPDLQRGSFTFDTSSFFDQLGAKPATDISSCFSSQAPQLIGQSINVLDILEAPDSDVLAVWRFSPVAISSDRKHALMIGANSCGGLCGGGAFYLFEKVDGAWRLAGHSGIWIS